MEAQNLRIPYHKTLTLSSTWTAIEPARTLIQNVTLLAFADNADPVEIKTEHQESELPAGKEIRLGALHLDQVQVKGTPGDKLSVFGMD